MVLYSSDFEVVGRRRWAARGWQRPSCCSFALLSAQPNTLLFIRVSGLAGVGRPGPTAR